jgi:hypothetical protein|tara:strand:+ start:914 stop:1348 length:435 start_codon:yes stop_codon:yes gene_type:complete
MPKGIFRLHFGKLVPADPKAEASIAKLKHGECIQVDVRRPRNLKHHMLFFAMLNLVFENQEYFRSVDDLLDALKIAIGHTKTVVLKSGAHKVPLSISFASMGQVAFDDFFDRAANFLVTEVIPGMDKKALLDEVMLMVGPVGKA